MKSISIFNAILKRNFYNNRLLYANLKLYSTGTETAQDSRKNVESLFIKHEVQNILKKITGLDLNKIFAKKNSDLSPHKYKFVTEKQLKELQEEAKSKALQRLQMPPVMSIREPINEVLSKDPELQGYLKDRTVFTDISSSVNNRERVITVRETDGTLRKATWEERDRMNQIFFPIPGRNIDAPPLFESHNLEHLLESQEYVFVLDSACIQFEPDSLDYHRVTETVYEHVKRMSKFDVLRSTRHFGPMVFYFALKKNIDDLLVDMIKRNLISDASYTIKLLLIVNPELKVSLNADLNEIAIIQEYVKKISTNKGSLELALQTYIEQKESMESEVDEKTKASG